MTNGMAEADGGADSEKAPAVVRVVRILEYLAEVRPEASLAEIASALALNKSSCFNILKALTNSGVVVRDARYPVYRLGPKLVALGASARRNYSTRELVRRELAPVVEAYGLACLVAQLLPNEAGIVVTEQILPAGTIARTVEDEPLPGTVITAPIGQVRPLSVPAMGRAVLATRPFAAVVGLMSNLGIGEGPELHDLAAQLQKVRADGFATSIEEYRPGINAVATTVAGWDHEIILILCMLGPADVFLEPRVYEAGSDLHQVAKGLEWALNQSYAATT
ncbi:MAG: helix-turn-helix domain-containing protein [Gaiellaceae bacterium MAG52_C11]|nr:helix-turn-helix domain-containing protein [Candidatus Gaiellasilicea maunaloa]